MSARAIRSQRAGLAEAAARRGLYRPETERDSCGVGFIAHIKGKQSHEILAHALEILLGLTHRGGVGSDPLTGDGCGVLSQIPHRVFAADGSLDFALPEPGDYAVGQVFLPPDRAEHERCEALIERALKADGLVPLGWRTVPVDTLECGPLARETRPHVAQVFVGRDHAPESTFELALFRARKRVEQDPIALASSLYLCSLSTRTIVYKGLLLPERLNRFYLDLADPGFETALAIVHQRFSTNTFPSWERAHPYRLIAHNGEINTMRGNVNAMRARESLFTRDERSLTPVIDAEGSDSAMFDNAIEFLCRTGRSLPHAIMMTIPETWETSREMQEEVRAFYEYHASVMEPWDGPALVAFSDGRVIGGSLDRNGLRPARYVVTHDDLVIMSSEAGVLDIAARRVKRRDRLRPGRMLLVDTGAGRIVENRELKTSLAGQRPYRRWLERSLVRIEDLPAPSAHAPPALDATALVSAQRVHGYTREDLLLVLAPMASAGQEPLGAMGDDSALAVLSDRPQLLFNYFKQLFAQVTNPPIDHIREALVMSLRTLLGRQQSLLAEGPGHCRQLALNSPVLTDSELRQIRELDADGLRCETLSAVFPAQSGALEDALRKLCEDAARAVEAGSTILILSDREQNQERAPIPILLAVAAVNHHLVQAGLRPATSLVVESGEAREVMHFCLLVGYGASAINPYLAYASIDEMRDEQELLGIDRETALARYTSSIRKGILKVLSKMGISTVQSYQGAQIFEAVGLGHGLIEAYFPGTASRLGGIELDVVEAEYLARHAGAYVDDGVAPALESGGRYKWRRDGERHQLTPNVVGLLQHGVRSADYDVFKKYSKIVNEHTTRGCDIRGLLEFVAGEPVPIEEVEPAAQIVRRFRTGAMSFGSLSKEAHETLALAMNRLGARSNSGEGGEDEARYQPSENGLSKSSAIKQIASGRFGVTPEYLLNAEELQIKMAQGAKPGEGGHLPGHKVDETIARVRHSTPGVGLISPPPHHDIYSIEDLAQLIYDLKHANRDAKISVKLVSEVGVGTVAAGVAKAKADHIVISGHSGGTGASVLSSIKHAGLPWELGLAEAQQVLMLNGLRSRVTLEVDGQLKTGRDVAIAALLGAENFAFGTAALIASGCILMRVCHLNTCPVGVATQDPALRKHFSGLPDHVMNFMVFVAEEVREQMAALGFRRMDDMIGRVEKLRARSDLAEHWKLRHLDLSPILYAPENPASSPRRRTQSPTHNLDQTLGHSLIERAAPALERGEPVQFTSKIGNVDRTVGTMLAAEITRRHGARGLRAGSVGLRFEGAAGQSFAAFLAPGMDVVLEGIANDSFAKGMAGGRVALLPPAGGSLPDGADVIVGNVALYGATGGEAFVRGEAGERFAVRNSGALAVVEGVGDHGCEYMTGGTVLVLGQTGRNFAAGMSGGLAYVLDEDGQFSRRCNLDMVSIEPLGEEDRERVHALVRQHCVITESPKAWQILAAWPSSQDRFVKVMPHEYERALKERERRETLPVAAG